MRLRLFLDTFEIDILDWTMSTKMGSLPLLPPVRAQTITRWIQTLVLFKRTQHTFLVNSILFNKLKNI